MYESRDFPVPDYEPDNPYDYDRRLDLESQGYSFSYADRSWSKVVSRNKRGARKDHADGVVRAGEHYEEKVVRHICDVTSNQTLTRWRRLTGPSERSLRWHLTGGR